MSGLSDYEVTRMENIKRNAQFLLELDIATPRKKRRLTVAEIDKLRSAQKAAALKRAAGPTRRSCRLNPNYTPPPEPEPPVKGPKLNYADLEPLESDELDDEEFQVFAELKLWRLLRSRELVIEPYKIFQNRTIAEFVRRKRSNPDWAALSKAEEQVQLELLDCWGIGPRKVRVGRFAWEMNELFCNSTTAAGHLEASRNGTRLAAVGGECEAKEECEEVVMVGEEELLLVKLETV